MGTKINLKIKTLNFFIYVQFRPHLLKNYSNRMKLTHALSYSCTSKFSNGVCLRHTYFALQLTSNLLFIFDACRKILKKKNMSALSKTHYELHIFPSKENLQADFLWIANEFT